MTKKTKRSVERADKEYANGKFGRLVFRFEAISRRSFKLLVDDFVINSLVEDAEEQRVKLGQRKSNEIMRPVMGKMAPIFNLRPVMGKILQRIMKNDSPIFVSFIHSFIHYCLTHLFDLI